MNKILLRKKAISLALLVSFFLLFDSGFALAKKGGGENESESESEYEVESERGLSESEIESRQSGDIVVRQEDRVQSRSDVIGRAEDIMHRLHKDDTMGGETDLRERNEGIEMEFEGVDR